MTDSAAHSAGCVPAGNAASIPLAAGHSSVQARTQPGPSSLASLNFHLSLPPSDEDKAGQERDANGIAGHPSQPSSMNARPNDSGLADKYSSTKLVGGTEVISQNVLLESISRPEAAMVEVTELFSFWRPNHPQSTARRKSAALTLTERQQDIMYALAGCADVRFLISRVHGQVRMAIEHQYKVDKFNFATWFKNRGQNPSKGNPNSLHVKRPRSHPEAQSSQPLQQQQQQQQHQQILQLPQCDPVRVRPPSSEKEQDARQYTVDSASWVRSVEQLPSFCRFPNLPQPLPDRIPVMFINPSQPLYSQLMKQYADKIPSQAIQFCENAVTIIWQQSGGGGSSHNPGSQTSHDDPAAGGVKMEAEGGKVCQANEEPGQPPPAAPFTPQYILG